MIAWQTRLSFHDTAADLSTAHLAQGIQETRSIIYATALGWDTEIPPNHPVLQGWIGYEPALAAYNVILSIELARQGVADATHLNVAGLIVNLRNKGEVGDFEKPPWIEDKDVLRSHRSNMVRRWPGTYQGLWKGTPRMMPYLWPFVDGEGGYRLMVSKHDKGLLASGERFLPDDIRGRVANL